MLKITAGDIRQKGRRKWYLFYALCDETYAMLSRDETPVGVDLSAYRLFVTMFDQGAWLLGSFLGGWIGTLLNFDSTGIDFAMTALFVTVFIDQWKSAENHIPAVLGVAATLAAVCLTHLWKHNTILSVVTGTVLYMILVQIVF